MLLSPYSDVAGPGLILGLLALGLGALVMLYLIIVLIESVVMQLMSWGDFRHSLVAALLANLVSTIIGFPLLLLVPSLHLLGLAIDWLLSILIEGIILLLMNRQMGNRNWLVSFLANSASYIILLLPAYLLSR